MIVNRSTSPRSKPSRLAGLASLGSGPKRILRAGLVLAAVLAVAALARAAQAAGVATFTVTVNSAYLRSAPSFSASRVRSVFQGQKYGILGKTADATWLRLDFAGADTETWALASYGTVNGDLNGVPVTARGAEPPAATPVPNAQAALPAPNARAITPVPPGPAVPASAATHTLRFTLTVKSIFMHSAPDWAAEKTGSLFLGNVFTAVGRTADSNWIEIVNGGTPAWVPAGAGQLSGYASELAVTEGSAPAAAPGAPGTSAMPGATPTLLPGVPVITAKMRQEYEQAPLHGNNPFAFATAGDCNSESYIYLELIAAGIFDVRPYPGNLAHTVGQFYPSFMRKSVAVRGGFGAASMFNSLWADPAQCQPGEGPFACELRVTKASIVFIALGTGDHLVWHTFEQNYRRLIEYSLSHGVLPVLMTKADDLEATVSDAPSGYINGVIRRLGQEYEVPVMDFDLATQGLYNHGLLKNDFHVNVPGIDAHALLTVQTLAAIWQK
jgi:uncharacterized protein YraI